MAIAELSLQVFANNLVMNRQTLATLFDFAFDSHERRNQTYRDEVMNFDFSKPLEGEQKEWMDAVGEQMMNDDIARKVYAGTVITVLNAVLQRFSAGLGMGTGYNLDMGPSVRGHSTSRVLWAARNMVQHHDEWEHNGEDYVKKEYRKNYDVLVDLSRGGGGVIGVDALDVLIRLTEDEERKYSTLERKVYATAIEIVKAKWPK